MAKAPYIPMTPAEVAALVARSQPTREEALQRANWKVRGWLSAHFMTSRSVDTPDTTASVMRKSGAADLLAPHFTADEIEALSYEWFSRGDGQWIKDMFAADREKVDG